MIRAAFWSSLGPNRTSAILQIVPCSLRREAFNGLPWGIMMIRGGREAEPVLGLVSRAAEAEAGPRAVPVGAAVQKEEHDPPLIIANLPATGEHVALAVGVAILLIVAAAIIAPFASIQLDRVDAFIPVLQTSLSLADFITATLL